jgi:hypothetical protein
VAARVALGAAAPAPAPVSGALPCSCLMPIRCNNNNNNNNNNNKHVQAMQNDKNIFRKHTRSGTHTRTRGVTPIKGQRQRLAMAAVVGQRQMQPTRSLRWLTKQAP